MADELTDMQKAGLLKVIDFWENESDDGYRDLPEGINGLRNARHDDLRHVGIEVSND